MFDFYDSFFGEGSKLTHVDNPPVELYKQYFSEDAYNPKSRPPDELIKLDIEVLSLSDSWNLGQQEDIEYIAKFLSKFCKNSKNYDLLSRYGKEKIDAIFCAESPAIQQAVTKSGCIKI